MDSNNSQDEGDTHAAYRSDGIPFDPDHYISDHSNSVNYPPEKPEREPQTPFQTQRWNRLRKHYNDRYLDLFKDTFATGNEDFPVGDLPPTQLGAVLWNALEKEKLYGGLSRKGRHDLKALAQMVGSKSEVEIKAYLDNLREQDTNRQIFEAQPKNISHADIPAAIEVGPECEAILDRAAEALSAFQDEYDFAAGQQTSELWLIDSKAAAELDEDTDQTDGSNDNDNNSHDESARPSEPTSGLFYLSTFLALSERFFMNKSPDDPDSWQNLAEEGQHPALTMDFVNTIYDLVVSLTRRLIQSSLFIAKSRIRSSTSTEYKPGNLVKSEDVAAALDVLNQERNSRRFWIGLARRNGLTVVNRSHKKGINAKQGMSYDELETILATARRKRSVSTGSGDSIGTSHSSADDFEIEEPGPELLRGYEAENEDLEAGEGVASDEDDHADASGSSDEGIRTSDEIGSNMPASRQRKRHLQDIEQDRYMETLDQEARRQEESRLSFLINDTGVEIIKGEEAEQLGGRPQVLRKTPDECRGWTVKYQAEWERYGEMLPAERFLVPEYLSKKRRTD